MNKKSRARLNAADVFLTIGLLLLAAALFWALANIRNDRHAGARSEETLNELLTRVEAQQIAAEALEEDAEEDPEEFEIPDYLINPDRDMPVMEIGGKEYLGYLSIPSLELELPIAAELNRENLKIAPCYYTGSIYQDNMVIAAHNYQRHFGLIGMLQRGDPVNFTDADGNEFHYTVALVEVLEPFQVEEMTDGTYPLTLFTCTIGGQHRVTVRCEKAP